MMTLRFFKSHPATPVFFLLGLLVAPAQEIHSRGVYELEREKQRFQISMENLGGNTFEMTLSPESDAGEQGVREPIALEITVGSETPLILSSDGIDTIDIVLNSIGTQVYRFDELTLPSVASDDYKMKINQISSKDAAEIEAVELSVAVGCSDETKGNLMECFVTCNHWIIRW